MTSKGECRSYSPLVPKLSHPKMDPGRPRTPTANSSTHPNRRFNERALRATYRSAPDPAPTGRGSAFPSPGRHHHAGKLCIYNQVKKSTTRREGSAVLIRFTRLLCERVNRYIINFRLMPFFASCHFCVTALCIRYH